MIRGTQRNIFSNEILKLKQDIQDLKEAEKYIIHEKPTWKVTHFPSSTPKYMKRDSLVELSELVYPWFSSLETSSIYKACYYFSPYSIRLYERIHSKGKRYELQIISPDLKIIKKKRYSNFRKMVKSSQKQQAKLEKMYQKRVINRDKELERRQVELTNLEIFYGQEQLPILIRNSNHNTI